MTSPPQPPQDGDPIRAAGFQRIETIYTTPGGALHSRTDWITRMTQGWDDPPAAATGEDT